jgi:LmbE family N-acetylglucosaminyl deacetylase
VIPLRLPPGPLRIVCVGAHPDDVEIGCGATLLTLAQFRDISATFVVATATGERYEEALKAASRFLPGAAVNFRSLGLRDGFLPAQWGQVKEALEEAAKSVVPDVIFGPRVDDAHQDHRLIAELLPTVWRDSLLFRYEIPKWDGDLGRVTHYVPVESEVAHRKIDLLDESFPSQLGRDWWDRETFLSLMRLRGVESRARYAEGFVVDKAALDLR